MTQTKSTLEFPFAKTQLSASLCHASRMIHLLQILNQGRGFSIEDLCKIYQTNARTLYRDLNAIRTELNVQVSRDSQTYRYMIKDANMTLPAICLTLTEALTLVVLGHEFGIQDNIPFCESAVSAVSKIQSQLSPEIAGHIENIYQNIQVMTGPNNPLGNSQPFYYQLLDALHSHKKVAIRYNSLSEEERLNTVVAPYQLTFQRRSWFCLGASSLHNNQVRSFNLGRFLSMSILDDDYTIPENWSLKKYLKNAWNMIPGPIDYHVVIDFSPMVGNNVAEIMWHKKQKTKWLNKRSKLRFETTVSGLSEIVWWVLGYGSEATVVEPPELKQMVIEHVQKMARQYQVDLTEKDENAGSLGNTND